MWLNGLGYSGKLFPFFQKEGRKKGAFKFFSKIKEIAPICLAGCFDGRNVFRCRGKEGDINT